MQFLWQITHTFNNVLATKKWDSINVCVVLVREREGGACRRGGGGVRNVGGDIRNVRYCVRTKILQY
jgi:hypothetical protein